MAENAAVGVEQRHSEVADGAERLEALVVGVQLEHPVGDVRQPAVVDHRLAGRVGDVVLEVAEEAIADPEGERPQAVLPFEILGHPGALLVDGAGQVPDELVEERLAGLDGGAVDDLEQGLVIEWSAVFLGGHGGRL